MKIEINIDIEAIVREEVRAYIRDNIVINNVANTADIVQAASAEVPSSIEESIEEAAAVTPKVEYKYQPQQGKRRNHVQIAFGNKELELGGIPVIQESP